MPAPSLPISAALVGQLDGPPWLQTERAAAWERFTQSELPTEAEEIWRYSRVDDLRLDRYTPAPPGGHVGPADLPGPVQDLLSLLGSDATVVISHNGGPAQAQGTQPGLYVGPAEAPLVGGQPGAGLGGPPPEAWTDLNGALVGVPWRVSVEAGAVVEAPVVVVHWLSGQEVCVFPRLEVVLGANAEARVVEVVACNDEDLLAVPYTQLVLGDGARLGFVHTQLLGANAWQLGNQLSQAARDATLRSFTLSLGGSYARVRTGSVMLGPGAGTELLAAYFGSGDQMHDLRTVQHHAAPRCRSELLFKGAVADHAHSVYSGLIRVEKGAKGTNAFQTNRNLVLSEGAQADSVPNLEIEDNDVRCSHASAVGPIDESQLFYLESRGVPPHAAERLIALGFLDDVIERCPVPALVPWARQQMQAKLASAGFAAGRS